MADDHSFLTTIKGVQAETFVLVTFTSDHSSLTRMSGEMTEHEVWAYFHKQRMTDVEITSHIEHARRNPM
jgi:flagellar biosynthesis/type III secretory pathway ATPase